ncbi:hypothetical protein D3C87_1239800 [compost metagenome]
MQFKRITQSEVLEELQFQVLALVLRRHLVLVCYLTVDPRKDRVQGLQFSFETSGILLTLSLLLYVVLFPSLSIILHLEFEDVSYLRLHLRIARLLDRRTGRFFSSDLLQLLSNAIGQKAFYRR